MMMKKLFKTAVLLLPLTGLGAWCGNGHAVTITSTAAGGLWSAATTWVGGVVPTTENVVIAGPVTLGANITLAPIDTAVPAITVNAGSTLNLSNRRLRLTGALSVSGTINLGTNIGSRFAGLVTVNAGGVWSNASNVAVNFRGGITNNGGTFTAGTGIQTFDTVAQAIGGTSPITIPSMTVTAVAVTNNGNLTVSTALAGTGNLINSATGTLNIGAPTVGITTLTATAPGNTVNYSGAAQTVKTPSGAPATYFNLGLGGSGIKIMPAVAMTVAGNLTLSGTASASTAGNLMIGGNLDVGAGTTFTSANFTNSVTGTTAVSGTLAHTGVAAKTYIGAVTINAGGTWTNTGNAPITFQNGLAFNGATFSAGTGIYTFSTTAVQSVDCAVAVTIPSITVTAPTVLTNNCNLTVSTALAGTGNLTNGAAATLNIGGTSLISTLTATSPGNIVNYTGTAQTIIPTAYDTLNVTGTATNSGAVTVAAALGGTGALTNAATGTLTIGGTATVTTLTAFAIGNVVNYTGATAQTVIPTAYHHLGLGGSGAKTMAGVNAIGGDLNLSGAATMTANAGLTISGALNYSSTGATTLTAANPISIGSFNQISGTFIDGGNTITVSGTGANTWSQPNGSFTPTGTVIFTGAAPQIGLSNFNNLTINVGAGNTAMLNGNGTASGVLTLTSGSIATGSNILEVTSSCATGISGGSAVSFVRGNLRLHYPTSAGATTCTFPIGDATAYAPATVTITGVTSTLANSDLTVRTDPADHADTVAGASGVDAAKSVNRYWTLTPGASLAFAAYDTRFTFVAGDIDGGAAPANFIIGRKNGGLWYYPAMGARNPTDTTATGMALSGGFGEFVAGERVMPSITVLKTVTIYSDPVNLLVNPKHIPGAIAQYIFIASNSGGPADDGTTFIVDPVPANTALYVNDIGGAGSGPVLFTQGVSSSTLTYTFSALNNMADDVSFSNDGGATWNAVPVADAFGCDATVPAITHIRINPKGSFAGSAVAPSPGFQLTFRVCVR